MGVTGLWRLIEPAGKPVPVETLENKVLAVDVSIWLHQMVKGYQDAKGAPLPNAHLIGLFQRLCKLLYFRIKPVFVFDGGFPDLKKETIAKRQDSKNKYNSESERLKRELALILSKKTAVNSLLGKQTSPKKGHNSVDSNTNDDIFKLPALPHKDEETESEYEDEDSSSSSVIDLHSVDMESTHFKSLPVKEKYDLLLELKETRKMNSWGKLHELPKKSDNFSDFQMQRLLKRRKVQECLEETEKEMGDTGMSLNDLESLLNEEGIDTKIDHLNTRRIASSDTTRFLLIDNVKQALAEAKRKKEAENEPGNSTDQKETNIEEALPKPKRDELEEDLEKAIKMSLECADDSDKCAYSSKTDDSWTSIMTDTDYADSDEDYEEPDVSSAKAYIQQYSDYTHKAIDSIVANTKRRHKTASTAPNVDQIIDELKNEKSIITDNVELSSDDDNIHDRFESSSQEKLDCDKELNTSVDSDFSKNQDKIETTQSSVIYVENPVQDTIILDTSTEIDLKETEKNDCFLQMKTGKESSISESEEEFEDVPDIVDKNTEAVVQLTLNMGDVPEDDIFADVFIDKKEQKQGENKINEIIEQHNQSKELIEIASTSNYNINDKENNVLKEVKPITTVKENFQNIEKEENINKKIYTPTTENEPESINPTSDIELNNTEALIPPEKPISVKELSSMAEELQNEEQDLLQEKGRLDRIGRNITEQMTKEAQELLQIFGIPYIVAPMEAEAQCAFLESIKLTDGTITDDSDIWLFGGRTVYKNFFNQKKHVLQFLAERIERSYNLNREQLVLLALLVGSDYTTGLTGVGPVTALEILASFPFNKKLIQNDNTRQAHYTHVVTGLQEFKAWVRAGRRTDNTTLKKKLRNINFTDDFPSLRVVQAYLEPNIEKSDEKFTWGKLDITILRDYTKAKFGWSQNKLDEIITPVLKRLVDRKSQKSVFDFFKRKVVFEHLDDQMSKRVKAAVQKMGPEGQIEEENSKNENDKVVRKRKIKANSDQAGPSNVKQKKDAETRVLKDHAVKIVSQVENVKSGIEIIIPKSDRVQEIIPQREKDKQNILQNKMKAIEIFRKTKIDRKRKVPKKRVNVPKERAELSESSDD